MADIASPEARALVEWWWNQATSAWSDWTDPQGVTALALAIDAHREAAVLAEREACAQLLDDSCTCPVKIIGSRRKLEDGTVLEAVGMHSNVCATQFSEHIRARTPPAGRGTR